MPRIAPGPLSSCGSGLGSCLPKKPRSGLHRAQSLVPGRPHRPWSHCSTELSQNQSRYLQKWRTPGWNPAIWGSIFFFLMEHIAWEFALRNLSFLDCQWRNGTYLLNLESSRSPHFWAVCEGFDLKAEQAEDSELACWKAEARSLAQEVLDFSIA